jgi:hypothetical protein|tara:strand:- start:3138 stop:3485 length:348 start_codon:yes stop_codon:yes gene_type:complete
MTVIGVALFGLASFALAGAAFALMWKNLSDINKPIKVYVNDQDINHPNPLSSSNHPEVAEIETDEELLVVNFPTPETRDDLTQSLQDRIEELNEDGWEDDDDSDDDGDVPAIVRR